MFHRLALSTYPVETRRAGFETLSTSAKGTPPARTRHLYDRGRGAPGIGLAGAERPWACLRRKNVVSK
jgi:hypothetical protein